jgi:hypothetical protein
VNLWSCEEDHAPVRADHDRHHSRGLLAACREIPIERSGDFFSPNLDEEGEQCHKELRRFCRADVWIGTRDSVKNTQRFGPVEISIRFVYGIMQQENRLEWNVTKTHEKGERVLNGDEVSASWEAGRGLARQGARLLQLMPRAKQPRSVGTTEYGFTDR